MGSYENYIFLAICESSMVSAKKSNFVTHVNYCVGMNDAFQRKQGNLYRNEIQALDSIYQILEKVFSLTRDEIAEYIVRFYSLPKPTLITLEKCVIDTKTLYPFSLNGK